MTFATTEGSYFWSNGYAWGTCRIRLGNDKAKVRLSVLHGTLALRRFDLTGFGHVEFPEPKRIPSGESVDIRVAKE
jgi:hypothetical protein